MKALSVNGPVKTLLILFGDQLDLRARAIRELDKSADAILMMEVDEESTHVPSHLQRTVLFLSAMRHAALELDDRGWRVHYSQLDESDNTGSFDGELRRAVRTLKPDRIKIVHPGEWRVLKMVERWCRDLDVPVEILEDEHFLTTRDQFGSWAKDRASLTMEYFYRAQRARLDVLMDAHGTPAGGAWNFDAENRKAFKKAPAPGRPYTPRPDEVTLAVIELVKSRFPDAPGTIDAFRWPVTRREARAALKDFIKHRLPTFGTYEDAMWQGEPFLYHSLLSSSLNLKLLDPMECVEAAVEAFESGDAPINAVEGFVRQLIGWREFIRGVYWHEGPGYQDRNGLQARGSLPEFYWSGETDMACLADCTTQVIEHGYSHHIPRLMVLGNFALIAGVHPRQISDWFLSMFVDAVDWVTLPNTLGMSQHADGGVVGTKPYASSGKYIDRMSNYCKHCSFDNSKRTGADACPFNTLYWDFLLRNEGRFKGNARMALMMKHTERMKDSERAEITKDGARVRRKYGVISS